MTADCGKNYEYCDRNLSELEALIKPPLDSAEASYVDPRRDNLVLRFDLYGNAVE